MTVKRKDFQKAAALINEFLLKLDCDAECAELRDALNLCLLHMQRYYRVLKNRMQNLDKSNGSILAHSLRGLSPMTPFKDAPDKFQWKWFNLDNPKVASTLPSDVQKDMAALQDIIVAAKGGENAQIMQLIEDDPDSVFHTDGLGRTALLYAVHFGHLDTVQILLENGADINASAHDGSTAVHRACHDGNHESLQILMSYSADVSVQDTLGRFPVHWACATESRECLRLLVSGGVDVNVRDNEGMSPSMWACRMDHIEHFELLGRAEQRIEEEDGLERDENGKTWMHWSVKRAEPLECLRTLLTEEAADLRDKEGKSVMHVAAEQGSVASAKVVLEIAGQSCLDQRDNNERTPLVLAAMGGHGEIINFLLAEGADHAAVDVQGATVWDYSRGKQLHYCMLIIASYIRQRAKQEEEEYGPLEAYTEGVGGTVNGIHSLQINGDGGDSMYHVNKPFPPPQPPTAPRTPRTPRGGPSTPRGVPSTPRGGGGAMNGWDTPTQRGSAAGKKRLTSGSDSNGEGEGGGEVRRREGSAGKRRKNQHSSPDQMSLHSIHSSAEFSPHKHLEPDPDVQAESEYLEGSDDENAEQEKSVSIAAMDVSDFEGGGVEGDDEQTQADDLEHHAEVNQGHQYQDRSHTEASDTHQGQHYQDRPGHTAYKGNRRSPPPQANTYNQEFNHEYNHEYNGHAQPQPSHQTRKHRSNHTHSAAQGAGYSNSGYKDDQYVDHEAHYDEEEDERPIPSPRQKSPPFSPSFQPAPLSSSAQPYPSHLHPLPPASPGRHKKKKKKRESRELAPVAGPVPPPRGAYTPPHPAGASHHQAPPSPRSRGDRGGSAGSVSHEQERYAQQKAALSSQTQLTPSLKPPSSSKKRSASYEHSSHPDDSAGYTSYNGREDSAGYSQYNGREDSAGYSQYNGREDPGRPPPAPQPAPRSRSHKLQPLEEQAATERDNYDSRRQYDDYHGDSSTRRSGSGQRTGSSQTGQRYGGPMPNGELPRDQKQVPYGQHNRQSSGGSSKRGSHQTMDQPPPSPRGRSRSKNSTPPINQRQTPNGRLPPTY